MVFFNKIIMTWVVLLLANGCVGGIKREAIKNKDYRIVAPGSPWSEMNLPPGKFDADLAYIHEHTGSALYLRSECHMYEDASLSQLVGGLMSLFKNIRDLKEEVVTFSGREAKSSEFIGELDGAEVKVAILVLKKNSCYFDFIFVSVPEYFNKDKSAYDRFLHSFKL
jgi:hypothetical protein